MASPLLGIIGSGLVGYGTGYYGQKGIERKREQFTERQNKMQEGLDLNTEAGAAEYMRRLMTDQDTFATGSTMLNASLSRAQQQKNHDFDFNNMSAAQKDASRQGDAALAETARYHSGSLGIQQQGLNLQRDEMNQRMDIAKQQYQNRNAWTPQQEQDEQNALTTAWPGI